MTHKPKPAAESSATPPSASIQVIQEHLTVQSRQVDTGRTVRVRKHVDEQSVEADTPTTHQRVDVQRVAIGRVIASPAAVRHEGEVLVIPVMEERVVCHTELVLVEEIHVRLEREVQPGRTPFTLRRERVVVERFDPASQQWQVEDA